MHVQGFISLGTHSTKKIFPETHPMFKIVIKFTSFANCSSKIALKNTTSDIWKVTFFQALPVCLDTGQIMFPTLLGCSQLYFFEEKPQLKHFSLNHSKNSVHRIFFAFFKEYFFPLNEPQNFSSRVKIFQSFVQFLQNWSSPRKNLGLLQDFFVAIVQNRFFFVQNHLLSKKMGLSGMKRSPTTSTTTSPTTSTTTSAKKPSW